MYMTQVISASIKGIAMRALAGNWKNGMISKMLQKKMKKNSEVRYQRYFIPSWPMVWRMTPSVMNSTTDSTMFWTGRHERLA